MDTPQILALILLKVVWQVRKAGGSAFSGVSCLANARTIWSRSLTLDGKIFLKKR
jgi:hypothetical protein